MLLLVDRLIGIKKKKKKKIQKFKKLYGQRSP